MQVQDVDQINRKGGTRKRVANGFAIKAISGLRLKNYKEKLKDPEPECTSISFSAYRSVNSNYIHYLARPFP